MTYDYIIVGGGLSGLYICSRLLKLDSSYKVLLLESNDRLGGRCETVKFKDTDNKIIQYEAGGARFSYNHKRVLNLLTELGLLGDKIKIGNTTDFITYPEHLYDKYKTEFTSFDSIISRIKYILAKEHVSETELRNTTLHKAIVKYCNKYYPVSEYEVLFSRFVCDYFTYWSEVNTLNALDAYNIFTNEFNNKIQYYVLKNGYSSIINKLLDTCTKYKGFDYKLLAYVNTIQCHNMQHIEMGTTSSHQCYTLSYNDYKSKLADNMVSLDCNKIILAIPTQSINKLKFTGYKNFVASSVKLNKLISKNLKTEPLYRIYARYPTYYYINDDITRTRINKAWFHNINKISTNCKLKFIIPVNAKLGIIMITYTDGDIAKQLNDDILSDDYAKQYETVTNKPLTITDKLNLLIKADLAKLFPDLSIPEPMWIKQYYWSNGAAYWTPTNSTSYTKYNVSATDLSHYLGNKICNILNENQLNKLGKVYIVNENISVHQAWIEGCLQSVNDCMTNYINSNTKINNNTYTITHSNHVSSSRYTANNKTRTHTRNMNGGKSKTKKASNKAVTYYTMDDVKKHNKKTDAWLVINKKVYDVTKWVPDHPGGNIILKGVGKDATELFKTIHSHGAFANNVLKKYYIGKLKT